MASTTLYLTNTQVTVNTRVDLWLETSSDLTSETSASYSGFTAAGQTGGIVNSSQHGAWISSAGAFSTGTPASQWTWDFYIALTAGGGSVANGGIIWREIASGGGSTNIFTTSASSATTSSTPVLEPVDYTPAAWLPASGSAGENVWEVQDPTFGSTMGKGTTATGYWEGSTTLSTITIPLASASPSPVRPTFVSQAVNRAASYARRASGLWSPREEGLVVPELALA